MKMAFISFVRPLAYILFILMICTQSPSYAAQKTYSKNPKKKENPGPYYVSSSNRGQLANQMFCVASTLAYAWDNDLIPVFPFLNADDANKSYNRDHIFFRIDASPCPKSLTYYTNRKIDYKPIPPLKDVFLNGPFFSWKYFHHHREKILEVFAPSESVLDYLYAKYADIISLPNTVGVHVRTTSREVHNSTFPFPGLKYFELAMANFPEDSIFVVFSDRINWCKKNFTERFPDKTLIFIEDNNHIQDLFLLSMMKHHILSNLTFSWWGAYLNTNPDQIVYVPFRLARKNWPLEDYYLPEWNIIPYDSIDEPYPADMYLYDESTKSLHEMNNR